MARFFFFFFSLISYLGTISTTSIRLYVSMVNDVILFKLKRAPGGGIFNDLLMGGGFFSLSFSRLLQPDSPASLHSNIYIQCDSHQISRMSADHLHLFRVVHHHFRLHSIRFVHITLSPKKCFTSNY